jgi:Mrp family chromosome partitioning ATPase
VNSASITEYVERAVDSESEVSLREFLSKVYVRPRLFWTCVLLPPILAVLLTALVPTTWTATAKILIRYSSTESPFLQGLIPDDRPALTGATSAELLKSIPALAETVQHQHIEPGDVARKPKDVITGYVSALLSPLFPQEPGPTLPGIDAATLAIASAFKQSLDDSGGFGTSAKSKAGVQVLEKFAELPAMVKGDELIELTVPSFNRTKVADMTNGLAQAFIDDYYRVSAEDAHHAYEVLSKLVDNAEAAMAHGDTMNTPSSVSADGSTQVTGGSGQIYRTSPLLEGIAHELAQRKSNLAHVREVFSEDSPEVARARQQVDSLERTLSNAQSLEVGKQSLEDLKARRYQAYNLEQLYRNRLVPISIIESAVTPRGSASKFVGRLIVAGVVGLVLGAVLGLSLTKILDILDQRLFTSWDVQRALGLPLLGWLPDTRVNSGVALGNPTVDAENGLLQILGRLDPIGTEGGARVVLIGSASLGEGKSFVCLQLATALARGGRNRVLLIDADPVDRSLTRHFGCENQPGLVDAVIQARPLSEYIKSTKVPGVDLVPAGSVAMRGEMGFYRKALKALLDDARGRYELLLIDTPSLLASNEALMCGMAADSVLLVAESGVTRKPLIREACRKLKEVGVIPQGVILNRRMKLLPDRLYRIV